MNGDKMESMLEQLIKMVGNIQSEQLEMKEVQQDMQIKLENLEGKCEEHHKEILERFKVLGNKQDFI